MRLEAWVGCGENSWVGYNFLPCDRDQLMLMPVSSAEWLKRPRFSAVPIRGAALG